MIRFAHLDKSHKDIWLPRLFELLYSNMKAIAPFDSTYDEAAKDWISEVSPALEKEPRQILLCLQADALIGYLQYYIRGDLLMIEELQIKSEYQRTLLFCSFCKQISRILPPQVFFVEAYAQTGNLYSQRIMTRLGMECTATPDGAYFHFCGELKEMMRTMHLS